MQSAAAHAIPAGKNQNAASIAAVSTIKKRHNLGARPPKKRSVAHKNPMMRAALVHINHHLKDRFGAPEIAEAIGITRNKLDYLFANP